MRRNCILKHIIEGKIEGKIDATGDEDEARSYWMTLKKERTLEIERGSTKSHFVENSPWKRLWTCLMTDNRMNESQFSVTPISF